MALWPSHNGNRVQGGETNASGGVIITAGATAHVKGAWSTLVTAADFDADMILLSTTRDSRVGAADASELLDIGFGPAGSERVVVENLLHGHKIAPDILQIPLTVPAGTRVSARLQSVVAGSDIAIVTHLYSTGGGGGRATTYGADTTTSSGTLLPLPTTNDTPGAWGGITPATTAAARWLIPHFGGPPGDTTMALRWYLVDIGVGAAGSEVVKIASISVMGNATEAMLSNAIPFPVDITKGTRLAARMQADNVTSADQIACGITCID